MKKIARRVELGERSYKVFIGDGILDEVGSRIADRFGVEPKILVVTNRALEKLYGERLYRSLRARGLDFGVIRIGDGERHKSFATLTRIYDRLIRARYDRSSIVVAFGGGVVGDVAGYAAATFMRGMAHVQVPTTLLAQVDSSVGGKCAINHRLGKNLIGAFHQPSLVIADVALLKSLPADEILCGLAETIKYGAIGDAKFFRWLEKNIEKLTALDSAALIEVVSKSVAAKADIVAADERESGARSLLNFGHTVGHAIEALTEYRRHKHGIAVAWGMAVATRLSLLIESTPRLSREEADRLTALLARAGFPASIPVDMKNSAILRAIEYDKKRSGANLKFVALEKIGKAFVIEKVDRALIKRAFMLSRRG